MPFPNIIDSSMRDTYASGCGEKFSNAYIHNLRAPVFNIDLLFGGAFAKGIETTRKEFYILGKPPGEAIAAGMNAALQTWGKDVEVPEDKPKTASTLLCLLDSYWKEWPIATDRLRPATSDGIEFSFAIQTGILHPDTGHDIPYVGRFDMLGTFDGMIMPVDEKTTGRSFFNFGKGWSLRGQFIGYVWAARVYRFAAERLLVRGCYVGKYEEAFASVFIEVTDQQIARWHRQLLIDIENMIEDYRRGEFDKAYGSSCTMYGRPCEYLPLCEATVREDWLSAYNVVEPWNPLGAPGGEL